MTASPSTKPSGSRVPLSSPAVETAVLGVVLGLAVFTTAWAVRASEGRRSLEAANGALERGDPVEAIVLARAAAEARCPSCDAPALARARLHTIAKDAESRGDDAIAVAAWRAARASTLTTTVIDPASSARQEADAEIARLEHRIDRARRAAAGGTPSPSTSEDKLRQALALSAVPSGPLFAVLGVGGALFLLGAHRFARARIFHASSLVLALVGGALAAAGILLF